MIGFMVAELGTPNDGMTILAGSPKDYIQFITISVLAGPAIGLFLGLLLDLNLPEENKKSVTQNLSRSLLACFVFLLICLIAAGLPTVQR